MVYLSKSAVGEIKRLRNKHHSPKALFRLSIQSSGCSGLSYQLEFDETVSPEDQVYTCDDIQVVVDTQNLKYIHGLTLDYSEDLMGGGFRFHNPNATQNCGCGNSFNIR